MVRSPASYRVLLIEEDPKQAELFSRLIREVARCRVDVMSQVENSNDWIANSNYNLVVIDNPSGGLELLEQIKRISPVTSVILISDRGTVEEAVSAIRMGAEDYFQKPVNLEAFRLASKRGLDRKTVFGENTGATAFLNLLNTCQLISAYLDQAKIFGLIQSYFGRELKTPSSAIYMLKEGAPIRIEVAQSEVSDSAADRDQAMDEILEIALHASSPLQGMSDQNEAFRFVERGKLTPGLFIFRFRCAEPYDYFCVCLSPKAPENPGAFEARLKMLRAQIEVTGKNIEQYRGVEQLAYVDDATGLYNTRYLHYILEREIARAESSGKSFAVLFIDADRFKSVNDTHGHATGTRLLNELGRHLRKLVRDTDTVFRYGGDEFVAVLSDCDLATAQIAAERIRASVENSTFIEEINLRFTVSIGVALFPDHARSKAQIIDAADHAMYAAKKTTRNAVSIAPIPASQGTVTSIVGKGASGG